MKWCHMWHKKSSKVGIYLWHQESLKCFSTCMLVAWWGALECAMFISPTLTLSLSAESRNKGDNFPKQLGQEDVLLSIWTSRKGCFTRDLGLFSIPIPDISRKIKIEK
jgi:hypothetical protein